MVDLAKIRKKAKKVREDPPPVRPAEPEPAGPAREPAVEPSAAQAREPVPPSIVTGAREPEETHALRAGQAATAKSSKLERFKEQAGRRRESEGILKEAETESGTVELLTFVIAREQYAVDIERIVEIVTPRSLTRIPNADASVVGIISLRGTIVTLVDVRRKLRHPVAGEPTADTRIVVVDFQNETVGFVVDRVLRVVKAAASEVEPHPVVHATELDESIRGVFRIGGALTILLDLDKLLDHRTLLVATA